MPLFDENDIRSEEMAALYTSRTILSTLASAQELLEAVGDAATAKTLIIPGPIDPPQNGEAFTVDELENRICWMQLYPRLDGDGYLVARSKAVGSTPEKEGYFRLHVHRQVRQAEHQTVGGRSNAWAYMVDRTSRLMEEFVIAQNMNLDNKAIKRTKGPLFNPKADHASQGIFLFVDLLISWGGSEHDQ